MADVLDDGEVVGDEQIGEAELLLQIHQQVDDLRLHRNVERRHRLVADDQLRVERQRAGDADALALPAGEFVRIAVERLGPQPDLAEQRLDALVERAARRRRRNSSSGSATMSRTAMRGLSDAYGSWNTTCSSRR